MREKSRSDRAGTKCRHAGEDRRAVAAGSKLDVERLWKELEWTDKGLVLCRLFGHLTGCVVGVTSRAEAEHARWALRKLERVVAAMLKDAGTAERGC